jgi:hypothetical protein
MAIHHAEEAQHIYPVTGLEGCLLFALNAESARGIGQVRRTVRLVKGYNTPHMNAMAGWLIEGELLQFCKGAWRQRKSFPGSKPDSPDLSKARHIKHQADLLIQGVPNGSTVATDENLGVNQALRILELEIGDLGRNQSPFHAYIEKQVF